MSKARKAQPDSFAEAYPTIADWVLGGGWIEIGYMDYTRSFVRALDEGGVVFEGDSSYPTLDAALKALDAGIWKPINDVGPGVREIRIRVLGEWRVLYVAKFTGAIYVLHAFQKKTQRTRRQDIELARKRYRQIGE